MSVSVVFFPRQKSFTRVEMETLPFIGFFSLLSRASEGETKQNLAVANAYG